MIKMIRDVPLYRMMIPKSTPLYISTLLPDPVPLSGFFLFNTWPAIENSYLLSTAWGSSQNKCQLWINLSLFRNWTGGKENLKIAIPCPQGSGTLRQQLLMMHWLCQGIPEYARVCQSMLEYARVCQSMPEYARVCQSMPEYARVCQSMPEYARVYQSMPEYARVCQSMPEYARVLPSFAKVVPKSSPSHPQVVPR